MQAALLEIISDSFFYTDKCGLFDFITLVFLKERKSGVSGKGFCVMYSRRGGRVASDKEEM